MLENESQRARARARARELEPEGQSQNENFQVENYFEMSGIRGAGSEALEKRQDINKEVGVYS